MSVTAFQDLRFPTATASWDGDAAESLVRSGPAPTTVRTEVPRRPCLVRQREKDNFGAYKLLIADIVDGSLRAVPRGVMAAAAVIQGSRGGVDLPTNDVARVKSHLAKYYAKMDDTAPWDKDG